MKRIIKFILSSGITLTLWFYFDDITNKIKAILFPKKTILKEIHKEMTKDKEITPTEQLDIHMFDYKKDTKSNTWLDYLDYVLWGDQDFKERLKTEGIWETLWKPYITSDSTQIVIEKQKNQELSTHEAVLKTDKQIKDTAIKSANHVQDVLSDYFQNNMSWIDYLIIQGFKLLAIFIFFLIIYGIFTILLNIMKKDKKV